MLKDPRPGRVKTRLGRDIGAVAATWWFRHQTAHLLHRLYAPRRWEMMLAVAPDRTGMTNRSWPVHLPRVAQGAGDLGMRMSRLLDAHRPGPTCIIGGDIPGITQAHIARAFQALGRRDAVFGPAHDGGFWLVGLKATQRPVPGLFKAVRWSTQHALADSIATLPGQRIALVDTLGDIDTGADLAQTPPGRRIPR
jgi:rSAM/selenodomain-associated transferase 1